MKGLAGFILITTSKLTCVFRTKLVMIFKKNCMQP